MPLPLKSKQHRPHSLPSADRMVMPSSRCEPNPCKYTIHTLLLLLLLLLLCYLWVVSLDTSSLDPADYGSCGSGALISDILILSPNLLVTHRVRQWKALHSISLCSASCKIFWYSGSLHGSGYAWPAASSGRYCAQIMSSLATMSLCYCACILG